MQIGKDYIGVGVGALIFNDEGKFLVCLRGPGARNEQGKWEIPGGKLEFGETLADCLVREIKEEVGLEIEVLELFQVADHILVDEGEHWVSPTYLCHWLGGTPSIQEPDKCTDLRWVTLEEAEQLPLSQVTQADVTALRARQKSGVK